MTAKEWYKERIGLECPSKMANLLNEFARIKCEEQKKLCTEEWINTSEPNKRDISTETIIYNTPIPKDLQK